MNPNGYPPGKSTQVRRRQGRTPMSNPCCPACGIKHPEAPGVCPGCLESACGILAKGWWDAEDDSEWAQAWRPAMEAVSKC
jgi:hypothetical protein